MPKITSEEWLNWLREERVNVVKLPISDPRKVELQALLKEFEEIERTCTEIDEYDPDRAEQLAAEIVGALKD